MTFEIAATWPAPPGDGWDLPVTEGYCGCLWAVMEVRERVHVTRLQFEAGQLVDAVLEDGDLTLCVGGGEDIVAILKRAPSDVHWRTTPPMLEC